MPASTRASRSSEAIPLTRSRVSTRRAVRRQSTFGTRKPASSAQFSASSEAAAASRRRSISIWVERARVATDAIGRNRRNPGCSRSSQRAIQANRSRSRCISRSMPGRRILTATSSPSEVTAKCTCAIEAAAIGRSSKLENSSAKGWPSSASSVARAISGGKGGKWSCRAERSAAKRSPNRSARVPRLWPSLMKLGPSSCRASAKRCPGRPAALWLDSRRASASTVSGIGSSSSGNRALCRARQRPMPSSRQRLRSVRNMP